MPRSARHTLSAVKIKSLLRAGGPKAVSPRTESLIRRKRAEGMGILKIAKEVGVGTSVVQRIVKAA